MAAAALRIVKNHLAALRNHPIDPLIYYEQLEIAGNRLIMEVHNKRFTNGEHRFIHDRIVMPLVAILMKLIYRHPHTQSFVNRVAVHLSILVDKMVEDVNYQLDNTYLIEFSLMSTVPWLGQLRNDLNRFVQEISVPINERLIDLIQRLSYAIEILEVAVEREE